MRALAIPSTHESASAVETAGLGQDIAEILVPGDVVLVEGELGAGKTTLVRGACRALGVREPVTSPTFTIGSRYRGRVQVAHLDLYRLEGLEAEDPALLADYLDAETVSFVEWPEHAAPGPELGPVRLRVTLTHLGGDARKVEIR